MNNKRRSSSGARTAARTGVADAGGIGMPLALRSHKPDREARALLRWFKLGSPWPIEDRSVRTQREFWRLTALAMGRRVAVDSVITRIIAGPGGPIEMRVFSHGRTATPRPAFLWCHGGGFMVGGLDTGDSICRTIARSTGCVVIAVRYRLAPEHELTACREDFLAVLDWVAEQGQTLGIDTSRLAIGGDSAGGNICAAVAQHATHRGGPALRLQVLVYPVTDLLEKFPSVAENAKGYLISARMMDKIRDIVVTTPDAADPWLSPRRHPDLQGLPPAVVVSAGFDPIRDDGLDYAARLRDAGVPVQLLHYPGQCHGFLNFDSVLGAGRDGLQRIAAALTAAFEGQPATDHTIEIADKAAPARLPMLSMADEVVLTSLVGWAMAERWSFTLLARLVPKTSSATRRLLESRMVPGTWLRRRAIANAERLVAHQSHPAA